jgi:hypothetical protein
MVSICFVTHLFCKALILCWPNMNIFINILLGLINFNTNESTLSEEQSGSCEAVILTFYLSFITISLTSFGGDQSGRQPRKPVVREVGRRNRSCHQKSPAWRNCHWKLPVWHNHYQKSPVWHSHHQKSLVRCESLRSC